MIEFLESTGKKLDIAQVIYEDLAEEIGTNSFDREDAHRMI